MTDTPEEMPTDWRVKTFTREQGTCDADLADEWRDGESRDGSDYVTLLMALAEAAMHDPAWQASHAGWLYTDDHRWDRDRAQRTLGPALGLRGPCAPLGDGYTTGAEESLPDYATRCNAAATAYRALVDAGYIAVDGRADSASSQRVENSR